MISTISIKNYALIEDIQVHFHAGLTVITGETGAGKSIVLNALGLILGKRADTKVARNPEKKCVVEVVFSVAAYGLQDFFLKHELDYEHETIVRREILPNGKSRAFVNDTPVNLNQLQSLGEVLIDIHSQNETQNLSSVQYQLSLLDAFAGNMVLLGSYKNLLKIFKEISNDLDALKEQKQLALKEQDYQEFVFNELTEANLDMMDQDAMEAAMERLNHLEEIKESLSVSLQVLQEDDRGGIDLLMDIRNRMMRLKGFGQQYDEIWQRLNSVTIELEDIASDMESAYESLEADPLELEKIDQQLQTLYRLQKKHGVDTVGELIELRNSLDGQLTSYEQIDAQIEVLQNQLKITEAELESIAVDLHKNRKEAIPKLEQELHAILSELALPYATFEFQLQFDKKPQSNGMDHLKVLFSANKGVSKGPLDKVASGGEMSRVMLSIKAVMASYKELPTMVFDEIDTGVSGEVAYKMAVILNKMSKRGQVFSITHLPQTAARGDFHKKVFKEIVDGTTRTLIKELSPEERILEIAQMIGGNDVSDSAITHAKQLLN